jgi:hypothetical protein
LLLGLLLELFSVQTIPAGARGHRGARAGWDGGYVGGVGRRAEGVGFGHLRGCAVAVSSQACRLEIGSSGAGLKKKVEANERAQRWWWELRRAQARWGRMLLRWWPGFFFGCVAQWLGRWVVGLACSEARAVSAVPFTARKRSSWMWATRKQKESGTAHAEPAHDGRTKGCLRWRCYLWGAAGNLRPDGLTDGRSYRVSLSYRTGETILDLVM